MNDFKDEVAAAVALHEAYMKLKNEISKIIIGQDEVVRLVLTSIFCQGHSLIGRCSRAGKNAFDQNHCPGAESIL